MIVMVLSIKSAFAFAQGTAPPILPPASAGPADYATKSEVGELYDQFRTFKNRLPFDLSAGVYLYYYQPLSETTLSPGDLTGSFQVYAFYLALDKQWHGLGGHAELRMRDGGHVGAGAANAYLRGFFSSNFWFQEIYAYYHPRRWFNLKAGKVYRQVGIFWDDSFFGNIEYFDGQKLNPDYGLSLEGEKGFSNDRFVLGWSAQYFYNSDGINGGLDYQRTVGTVEGNPHTYSPNPEGELDFTGARTTEIKHIVDGRLTATARPTRKLSIALGASGLTGVVHRQIGSTPADEARYSQAGGDLTVTAGPVIAYGEYLRQFGPGMRDADYVLAGVRAHFWRLSARFNASYVNYHLAPVMEEFILQPGVTATIGGGLSVIVEYDEWERRGVPTLTPNGRFVPTTGFAPYDRSLNVVLVYQY
ncbi:MAG TPA: hypothetical protein VII38_11565 [Polyangia bacterium]|jgi:hypothetical protein